jgi:hypothetical protein
MDAGIRTVQDLLAGTGAYLIPYFQRSYSWGEKQWGKLWEDVLALDGEGGTKKHFIGPLVTVPMTHLPGDTLARFEVIDGQQRLTTLSIFLGALGAAIRDLGDHDYAEGLRETYLIHHRRKDLYRYKLMPRSVDRATWQALVDLRHNDDDAASAVDDAWRWFHDRVTSHAQRGGVDALKSLCTTLSGRIAFVAILIKDENPYRVFESLNTTGLALTEFDLVRNHLFMRVPFDEQERFDALNWRKFEALWDDCVDKRGGVGRAATTFLRHFLARTAGVFPIGETFVQFRSWAEGTNASPVAIVEALCELAVFARHYRDIEAIRARRASDEAGADWPTDELDKRLLQLAYCDANTTMPLVYELVDRHERGELAREELLGCFHDLLSFLLRRALTGEGTKFYNRGFSELPNRLETPVRTSFGAVLHRMGWPSDAQVLAGMKTHPIYKTDSDKARLVLEEIERANGHREPTKLGALQVEHILPQTIGGAGATEWKSMLGSSWKDDHARLVHTIGNLTLTGYNPTLSNQSFEKKRKLLRESRLCMNQQVASEPAWTATTIEARAEALCAEFVRLFPVTGSAPELETAGRATRADRADSNRTFWRRVVEASAAELQYRGTPTGLAYMTFASGYRSMRMVAWIKRGKDTIGVLASFPGSKGERLFQSVRPLRNEIADRLGMRLGERDAGRGRSACFRIERAGVLLDTPNGETAAVEWLAEHVIRLRKAIEPALESLSVERKTGKGAGWREDLRTAWFEALLAHARTRTPLHALVSASADSWVSGASGVRAVAYIYVVRKEKSGVALTIWSDKKHEGLSKRRFEALQRRREAIDRAVPDLAWDQRTSQRSFQISLSVAGGYASPRELWPRIHQELVTKMIALHDAVHPYLAELPSE